MGVLEGRERRECAGGVAGSQVGRLRAVRRDVVQLELWVTGTRTAGHEGSIVVSLVPAPAIRLIRLVLLAKAVKQYISVQRFSNDTHNRD